MFLTLYQCRDESDPLYEYITKLQKDMVIMNGCGMCSLLETKADSDSLRYTSSLLEAMLPVFSFALLEPSDDPRIVCFLWSLHHSVDEDSLPFAVMYGLSYRNKQVNKYNNEAIYEVCLVLL